MAVALSALLLLAAPAVAQEIALQNPGFEQVADNDPTMPAGWQRWQATAVQVRLDQTEPFEGERCAALSPNPPGGGAVVLKQYFTQYVPGAEYEVVFAGRTNGRAGGRLNIINWTAIENKRGRSQIYPGTVVTFNNTDWQVFGTTFVAPREPGQQLYLELSHERFAPPEADIWWDDFSIRPVEQKHRDLLKQTETLEHELYTLLVALRFEVGSACDMVGYLLDDARRYGQMMEAQARPLLERAEGTRAAMERLHEDWHRRREATFDLTTPVTRLDDAEMARRGQAMERTIATAREEIGAEQTRLTAQAGTLLTEARGLAGDFTIPAQRAAEVTTDTLGDRFHRIVSWHGYMTDVDYVHRALWSLPATIVQGYLWREDKWPLRERFFEANSPRTFPYVERVVAQGWPDLTTLKANVERDEATLRDHPGFRGFEIDEPHMDDVHLATEEGYAAFRGYLAVKYPADRLRELGLGDLEGWTVPAGPGDDPVAWMEWQQFKAQLMAERLREAQEFIKSQPGEPVLLPVIQQFLPSEPQRASWVSVPAALDWIAMDPYNGGTPAEAFEMDLLRSNSKGPTYLVVGTCYDPTAERFNKDMCISLGHADGLWVWCWVYMTKYRAPGFLANGWQRQYRHLWKPGMWEAAQEVFAKIEAAEEYLVHTTSGSPIAVAFSERTGIHDSGLQAGNDMIAQFVIVQGLYQALHHSHLAPEAVFAESLTSESLSERQLLLLADARLLDDREIGVIRDWVRGGGTLIALGPTSLSDQWGRSRDDFALADVFGASHRGTIEKPGAIVPGEQLRGMGTDLPDQIALPSDRDAELVEPTSATVLATYSEGQPAVLRNSFGQGTAWLMTTRWVPTAYDGGSNLKTFVRSYHPGVCELLETMCRSRVPRMPVEAINCPVDVEMSLRRQGERMIVHLLNYANDTTVSGMSLHVRTDRPVRIFDPTRPEQALPTNEVEDGVSVAVPEFRNHIMLVVQAAQR